MLMTFLIEVGTAIAVCYIVVWGIILGGYVLVGGRNRGPDGLLTYDPIEDGPRLPR
jgi:hypothetical protein